MEYFMARASFWKDYEVTDLDGLNQNEILRDFLSTQEHPDIHRQKLLPNRLVQ